MSTSALRLLLETTASETGASLDSLTVLARQNDPFRVDTPARHRDGEWLAVTLADLGLGERRIHLRGSHYMLIGVPKPDGTPYTNTDEDWLWLQGHAAKAARWLGYIPFDQIVDQRNAEPTVVKFEPSEPRAYLTVGVDVSVPSAEDLVPEAQLDGFDGVQPFRLVLVGEKSSLNDVLAPIAQNHKADLFLPTGEISDTLAYRMAAEAAEDGRPLAVFYFSDSDPSGWQMPLSLGRKLQAFQTSLFPDLDFELHRVALTPEQVGAYGLPSTPLKASERRGDRWREATGTDQTEIDALASLRPDLLRRLANDALEPFYDRTLDERVFAAKVQWLDDADEDLADQTDAARLAVIRQQAETQLDALREEIDAINAALQIEASELDLPAIPPIPDAIVSDDRPAALLDSRWPFDVQCLALRESKAYHGNGDSP